MDKLLSPGQAAEILGISVSHLRRLVQRGELPAVRIASADNAPMKIDPPDLRKFIDDHKVRRERPEVPGSSVNDVLDQRRREKQAVTS